MSLIELLEHTLLGEALITFAVSMVPVVELRGAIPVGVGLGLSPWVAMVVSLFGNMVPIPFIILFIRRIFAWTRRHFPGLDGFVTQLEIKANEKSKTVKKYRYLGLLIFVAIPLPGTGAWTGALIAALMNMAMRRALPAIFLGVLIAGCIITSITYGVTIIL